MIRTSQHPVSAAFKIAFGSAALVAGLALQLVVASADSDRVTTLPAAVDAVVEAMAPGYVLGRAQREKDHGEFIYEIKGTGDGMKFEMKITESGTVLESEIEDYEEEGEEDDHEKEKEKEKEKEDEDDDQDSAGQTIPLEWLPAVVAATLSEIASDMKVAEAERKGLGDKYFRFEGTLDGMEIEVLIAADGTLLKIERDRIGNKNRENSEPAATLPDAVLSTLEESYPDLEIDEIEITGIDGQTVFEIEGMVGSKRVELYISPAGQVVRYEIDSDDDGLADTDESDIGSDPRLADTDGDAFPDGFETDRNSDPLNPAIVPRILSIDMSHGADGVRDAVVLTVSTFKGGVFEIEHCSGVDDFTSLGVSISGDNAAHEIVIPVDDPGACGFFRVALSELSAKKENPIGGGGGVTETGFAPDNVADTDFDVDIGNDSGKELHFDSDSRGQLVQRKGTRIEVEPFKYRYQRTGPSTARVTVTFPRLGDDLVVEYELEFTEDGKGSVVRSDSSGGDTGSFSYRKKSGSGNAA